MWDGNEVWLVLGGGVLFAVFPLAYASLFSGLYLAFVLVLLVMILRTVALEFRSKEPGSRWRSAWDTVFAAASTGLALLLGVAFGNIVAGLPLDADGNISGGLIGLLTPFALLVGVTTVAMFAMQGGIYLLIKTDGDLHDRLATRRAAGDDRVPRAEYARRRRPGAVPPEHLGGVFRRPLAGLPPDRRPRRVRGEPGPSSGAASRSARSWRRPR